jgi:hypothetical protein
VTGRGCEREPEVVEMLLRDGKAAEPAPELVHHVDTCGPCGELRELMTMLREETRRDAEVALPAAGQVWWRAAVRARMDAAHTAARPVTWAQGVTAAVLAGLIATASVLALPLASQLLGVAVDMAVVHAGATDTAWASMSGAIERALPLVLLVAALIVLMPAVVLYVALSGDD